MNYLIWSQKFPIGQTYFQFDGIMSLELPYMVTKVPNWSDLYIWSQKFSNGQTYFRFDGLMSLEPPYMVTKVPQWSDLFPVWPPHVIGTTLYGHKSSRYVRPISGLMASCHWNYLIWSQKFPVCQTYFRFDGLVSLKLPYMVTKVPNWSDLFIWSQKFPNGQTYFRFDGLMSLELPYMVTKVPDWSDLFPVWRPHVTGTTL